MTIEDSIGYYFKNKAYLEEALKEEDYLAELLIPIIEIEKLLQQPC